MELLSIVIQKMFVSECHLIIFFKFEIVSTEIELFSSEVLLPQRCPAQYFLMDKPFISPHNSQKD